MNIIERMLYDFIFFSSFDTVFTLGMFLVMTNNVACSKIKKLKIFFLMALSNSIISFTVGLLEVPFLPQIVKLIIYTVILILHFEISIKNIIKYFSFMFLIYWIMMPTIEAFTYEAIIIFSGCKKSLDYSNINKIIEYFIYIIPVKLVEILVVIFIFKFKNNVLNILRTIFRKDSK